MRVRWECETCCYSVTSGGLNIPDKVHEHERDRGHIMNEQVFNDD